MLTKKDILPLLKTNNLLTIEFDDRHLAVMNDIFAYGINNGVNLAKESIRWRINGKMWCNFIDEAIFPGDEDANAEAA